MSDFKDISNKRSELEAIGANSIHLDTPKSNVPNYSELQGQLTEASLLVDDIVLKNYLTKLTEFEVLPLDENLKNISAIRLFKINEMVYQKEEYSTYKFASVFNSVQNLNCGVFVIADSDGKKTDFFMGVRSLDDKRTTKSLKDTLRNALCGQFPGVKTTDLRDNAAEEFISKIESANIATVSCVAKNKDDGFTDNKQFIQGLEKLALAMQGQRYTAIVLAKSTPTPQLAETRSAYETIYTQLSPFATTQLSYGTNTALSVTNAFSSGTTKGTAHTTNRSTQKGNSLSESRTDNESITKQNTGASMAKGAGLALLGVASIIAAPLAGASLVAMGAISAIPIGSKTKGTSTSQSDTKNWSETEGKSDSVNESVNDTATNTKGLTSGTTDMMQLTMQNKTLINMLERIDLQLKRIDECESLGMWECATYFLSDSQETTEMAAGTYKALMKGEKSGIETSAINFWGRQNRKQLPMLREYITNFIHPVFEYQSASAIFPVTASSLISGNELAIQMGFPRKSVCGFPVIEHADFGKEVVKYHQHNDGRSFLLGKVFSMGSETKTEVRLDHASMTMHTFITGSTGSGKSNAVYEILHQLRNVYNVPFLVVEPAKGEYKNVFGQFSDVSVYGTNPKKTKLLRINPFRFPADIHVLEHLDRLVEIFNVCWPMYAAMPAILKEATERAYEAAGWNISTSENARGEVFPNFTDLLEQIENVINESKYSADSKGDYSGALCTRVRSLTNGLNGLIFCSNDLSDTDLFDKNVIVDLSRVGSIETKSLIMGLLVMKLNEYRMTSGKTNSPLSHITVLEEAHNLLKRTSMEQSSESSNLLGKSVELLANSIAEMRTYGEGFIIADQSPGLLDLSVIRNTNTKIILRLPEQSDRELVGLSAGLNKEQIEELTKLERGVAAVYQNDWVEPVLCKINKFDGVEKPYEFIPLNGLNLINDREFNTEMINLLLKGRTAVEVNVDIFAIEKLLDTVRISTKNKIVIQKLINEYQMNGSLGLWETDNFGTLSGLVAELLNCKTKVENVLLAAKSYENLTAEMMSFIKEVTLNLPDQVVIDVCHCLLRENSERGQDKLEIYASWRNYIDNGGGVI